MRVSFTAEINCLSGFTVSFAGLRGEKGNSLILPRILGQPYMPASTMRGKFRHTFGQVLIAGREKHQQSKLSLADLNWNLIGGVKQGKGEDDAPAADIVQTRPICANHICSFWGFADPVFQESKMQIEHALPASPITVEIIRGQRTDPVQRGEFGPQQVSDPASFEDWFGMIARRKAQSAEKKAAERKSSNGRRGQPVVTEETEQQEDAKAEGKIVATNMPFTREIVPPGARFTTHIDIYHASELQMGMFVATLREFSKRPVFGAQAGMNLGLVDLSLMNGEHRVTIDGRARSFEASATLLELEQQFNDAFPKIDFSIPVFRK